MARYIDADALMRQNLTFIWNDITDQPIFEYIIEHTPTAYVKEVKRGRWETIPDYSQALTAYRHICSECKIVYKDIRPYGHNYCPNCGAKMDGDSNEA